MVVGPLLHERPAESEQVAAAVRGLDAVVVDDTSSALYLVHRNPGKAIRLLGVRAGTLQETP